MNHKSKLYLSAFIGIFAMTVLYVQASFGATNFAFLRVFSPSSISAQVSGAFGAEFDPEVFDRTELKEEGFHISDVRPGKGKIAENRSEVTIHYTLETINGTKIRNTRAADVDPYSFTVGAGNTIKGMSIGILGMREGGTRTLVIPPQYAYGDQPITGIPPGEAMVFTVSLISVK